MSITRTVIDYSILHYLVFQRTKSLNHKGSIIWENDLSKPSKIVRSFLVETFSHKCASPEGFIRLVFYKILHRKEVIHPHVLVGIPCYDFTPVTCPTLGGPLPYGLGYRLQVLQTPMAWRAVCTTPGNVFTPTFWFGITSDSNFMESNCRLQSGLGPALRD